VCNGVIYNEWLGQYTTLDSNITMTKKGESYIGINLVDNLAFDKFITKLIVDN